MPRILVPIAILFALVAGPRPVSARIDWIVDDLDLALDRARDRERPIHVFLAGPCEARCEQRLDATLFADPELQAFLDAEFVNLRLGGEGRARFGSRFHPTSKVQSAVMTAEGHVVEYLAREADSRIFLSNLRQQIEAWARLMRIEAMFREDPNDREALRALTRHLWIIGHDQEALRLAGAPGSAAEMSFDAWLRFARGAWDEDLPEADLLLDLASHLWRAGHRFDVVRIFRNVARDGRVPDESVRFDAWVSIFGKAIGPAMGNLGPADIPTASHALERARAIDPNNLRGRQDQMSADLAEALWRGGRREDAEIALRRILSEFPGTQGAAWARFWTASHLEKAGWLAEAASFYEALRRENPNDTVPPDWVDGGWNRVRRRPGDEAIGPGAPGGLRAR